jgi:tetratricopeptide (TPR) repeat protein
MKKKTILILFSILIWSNLYSQEDAVTLNSKGIEYAKKGELNEALILFEKAIKIDPEFSSAYANRGNVYRIQKKYKLAINDFTKSFELKRNLNTIYARANSFLEIDDFQSAVNDYTIIIDESPTFSSIYFDRAYAYLRLENYVEAKKDLESQLQYDPKDFKSLANLVGVKKELGLYESAIKDYDKILEEFPNQDDLHKIYNNRANLYLKIKNYSKAFEDINKAIETKNDYDMGYLNRGVINMKLGNIKTACQDFNKAIKLGVEKNDHYKSDEDIEELRKLCK